MELQEDISESDSSEGEDIIKVAPHLLIHISS